MERRDRSGGGDHTRHCPRAGRSGWQRLPDDESQQRAPDFVIDVRETHTNGTGRNADDGDLIRDDSDVASVDGSANDAAGTEPLFGGSY